jgi:hypothetical protein
MWVRFDAVVHGCLRAASLQREFLLDVSLKKWRQSSSLSYLSVSCHQCIECSAQQRLFDLPIDVGDIQSIIGLGYNRGHCS